MSAAFLGPASEVPDSRQRVASDRAKPNKPYEITERRIIGSIPDER
jgi:hypothetical protein